jgi:hypothetical protein
MNSECRQSINIYSQDVSQSFRLIITRDNLGIIYKILY